MPAEQTKIKFDIRKMERWESHRMSTLDDVREWMLGKAISIEGAEPFDDRGNIRDLYYVLPNGRVVELRINGLDRNDTIRVDVYPEGVVRTFGISDYQEKDEDGDPRKLDEDSPVKEYLLTVERMLKDIARFIDVFRGPCHATCHRRE